MQYRSFRGDWGRARETGSGARHKAGNARTHVVRHGERLRNALPLALVALLLGLVGPAPGLAGLLGDEAFDDAARAALTAPGVETRIATPSNDSHMVVYVPSDYDPTVAWPLIVGYHGYRGRPTTWPFRQATEGEGFLVAGVGYGPPAYGQTPRQELLPPEVEHFQAVLSQPAETYSIDPDRVFMGGFSQGGYSTTVLGERIGPQLAGLSVLGAGRAYVDGRRPVKKAIWRKPVFVECGADDERHYPRAVEAAAVYRSWGAAVTFERWEGVGHTFDADRSTALGEWLRRYAATNAEAAPPDADGVRVIIR